MKQIVSQWVKQYFSDPEAVFFALLVILGLSILIFTGKMLAPVFAALVLAYLLEGLVARLEKHCIPHLLAVSIVFLLFIGAFIIALFFMLPLLVRQLTTLVNELPTVLSKAQSLLLQLQSYFPYLSQEQTTLFIGQLKSGSVAFGHWLLSFSIASIPHLITVIIFLVLVPLLVFFFLLDRDLLIRWFVSYLPAQRQLMTGIWKEVDQQLGNYVRGKFIEILIVGGSTFIPFALMGLWYGFLLSVLVGLSVLVPFIGVTVVTIPVELVAFVQFGWTAKFAYLTIIYSIICILDANLLVPLLFAEAVNLHPVAIIVAILLFGGIWGFWGVFFAIPLATFVQAVLIAWPKKQD